MPQELNPAQRTAVSTRSGPLLVLAGAGTGKTRVITYRIAELIRHGVAPERILAVTFTNKAAREMQERTRLLLPRRRAADAPTPEVSTFHSLCLRILRRHITRLGYPSRFSIYDRSDQETLVRGVLRKLHVSSDRVRPGELLAHVSSLKSRGLTTPADGPRDDHEQILHRAGRRYQEALRSHAAVDFDDLLLLTEELFRDHEAIRAEEARRFDHILVDEYQDTNGPQYRILRHLGEGHRNLCVVGDDDQSIYGWRGAEVRHILGFERDWPGARVVRLEQNYRSTAPILALANRLIACNTQRHPKELRPSISGGSEPRFAVVDDEAEEARAVVREIQNRLREPGARADDFAILFRTNEQPRPFEMELRRAGLPYLLVGGLSFYDRREIRDVLAYLKVLHQPQDEVALNRILNTPPRGIGKQVQQKLLAAAIEQGKALFDVLRGGTVESIVSAAAARAVAGFCQLIERYQTRLARGSLHAGIRDLLAEIDYQNDLKTQYKTDTDAETRWAAIEDLLNAVGQYESRHPRSASLEGFLQEILLDSREDELKDEQRPGIRLMTLHSAKGLEFPHVYLVGMEEGLLPHKRAVEDGRSVDEERRLAYVGVTRARESLTLTLAARRFQWGKARPSIPSRFLFEMKDLSCHKRIVELKEAATSGPPGGRPTSRGRKTKAARKAPRQKKAAPLLLKGRVVRQGGGTGHSTGGTSP